MARFRWNYPLVMINIAMENGPFIDGLTYILKIGGFSMAMLNNQMVQKKKSDDSSVCLKNDGQTMANHPQVHHHVSKCCLNSRWGVHPHFQTHRQGL